MAPWLNGVRAAVVASLDGAGPTGLTSEKDREMRNELTLASVFVVLGLSAASAQVSTDAAVKSLEDQGFTNIEVDRDRGDNELSIEGWRGDQKVEITYDTRTGNVIGRETETVRGGRAAEVADDLADDDGIDDGDDANDTDDDRDDATGREDDRDDATDRDDDRDDANDRDDDRNDNDGDDNDSGSDDNDSDDNDNDRDDD